MAIKEEWFRNTKWNAPIAAEFHEKLAKARSQRDQYLGIQARTLVRIHPEIALELAVLLLDTQSSGSNSDLLCGLEARAEALGELQRTDELCAAYREVFALLEVSPSLGSLALYNYPMYVARLKISAEYDVALEKCAEAEDHIGSPQFSFLQSSARALIYWEQGRREDARSNADIAVRFGNIRRNGFSVSYDAKVVGFNDNPALKRILQILKRTVTS